MSRESKPHISLKKPPGKEKSQKPKLILTAAILTVVGVSAMLASDIAERAEETLRRLNEAINQAEDTVGGTYSSDLLLNEVEPNARVETKSESKGDLEIRQLRERIQALQKDIKRQTSGDPSNSQDTIRTLMDKQDEVNRLKKELRELEQTRNFQNDPSMARPAQVEKLKKNYDKLIDDRNKIQKELFDLQKEHDKELQKLRLFFEQQYLARINSDQAVISDAPESRMGSPKPSHPIIDIEEPEPTVQPEVMSDLEAFLKQQGAFGPDSEEVPVAKPFDDAKLAGLPLSVPGGTPSSLAHAPVSLVPPETTQPEPERLVETIEPLPEIPPVPQVIPPAINPGTSEVSPVASPETVVTPPSEPRVNQPPAPTELAFAPTVEAASTPLPPPPVELSVPPLTVEPDPALAFRFTNVVEATSPSLDVPGELATPVEELPVWAPRKPVDKPSPASVVQAESPVIKASKVETPPEEPVVPTVVEVPQPPPTVSPVEVTPAAPAPTESVQPTEPEGASAAATASNALADFQFFTPVEPAKVNLPVALPPAPSVINPVPGIDKPVLEAVTSTQDVYIPNLPTFLPSPPEPEATPEALPAAGLAEDPVVEPPQPAPAPIVEPIEENPGIGVPVNSLPENENLVETPVAPKLPIGSTHLEEIPPLPGSSSPEPPSVGQTGVVESLPTKPSDPIETLPYAPVEYIPPVSNFGADPKSLDPGDVVEPVAQQNDPLLELLGRNEPSIETLVPEVTTDVPEMEDTVSTPEIAPVPKDTPKVTSVENEGPPVPAPPSTPANPGSRPVPLESPILEAEKEATPLAGSAVAPISPEPAPVQPVPSTDSQPVDALPETDFSIFDEPVPVPETTTEVVPPPASVRETTPEPIPSVPKIVEPPMPAPVVVSAPPALDLIPAKSSSEVVKASSAAISTYPSYLNDTLPSGSSGLAIYDLPSKKPGPKALATDIPQPIEVPESKGDVDQAEGAQTPSEAEVPPPVEIEQEPVPTKPKPLKRTPPPSMKSTVMMQIKAEVELLSGGKPRPADYTEFYITTSDFNDIIRTSGDLKETMDKAMVGKSFSSYAELWARSHKYGYNYPGLSSKIRKTLRNNGIHRIRTNASGEAKLRVSRQLAEDEDHGELYIIGVARLGKVGVVWSKPFYIQDHAGHDNPVFLEDADAVWLQ